MPLWLELLSDAGESWDQLSFLSIVDASAYMQELSRFPFTPCHLVSKVHCSLAALASYLSFGFDSRAELVVLSLYSFQGTPINNDDDSIGITLMFQREGRQWRSITFFDCSLASVTFLSTQGYLVFPCSWAHAVFQMDHHHQVNVQVCVMQMQMCGTLSGGESYGADNAACMHATQYNSKAQKW